VSRIILIAIFNTPVTLASFNPTFSLATDIDGLYRSVLPILVGKWMDIKSKAQVGRIRLRHHNPGCGKGAGIFRHVGKAYISRWVEIT